MTQQINMAEVRRELVERGIASEKAMYENLSKASKRLRLLGIRLIEDRGRTSAIPLLADLLEAEEEEVQMAAASALATIGGRPALLMLTGILEIEHRPSIRQAAVHALAFMFEDEAFGPLLAVLQNSSESPTTRGMAAEGLANLLEHSDSRKSSHRRAVAVLIKTLGDESPRVRFWASFALGCLKSHQAIPHLRRLVETDKSVCRGWWSVAREAEDALLSIQGIEPPERIAKTDNYS
jgi:HEAT repeat protein